MYVDGWLDDGEMAIETRENTSNIKPNMLGHGPLEENSVLLAKLWEKPFDCILGFWKWEMFIDKDFISPSF